MVITPHGASVSLVPLTMSRPKIGLLKKEKNGNNKKYQFWMQHNQPIVLNNAHIFEQKLNYIHNNPVEIGFVDSPEEYIYSSARDYADEKGLVKVSLPG